MFKKLNPSEDIHGRQQIKSSVQRSVRAKLVAQFPRLASILDEILPKKAQLTLVKCTDRISIYMLNHEALFFQRFDDAFFPTLRLVHRYPSAFPRIQIDRGAIKFVLSGANIMCPGLTSKGARMDEELDKGSVVTIYAEGKDNAIAIGYMQMSTREIAEINKGIGVDNIHYLGDALWNADLVP